MADVAHAPGPALIWQAWNQGTTATTLTTQDSTWANWVSSASTTTTFQINTWNQWNYTYEETLEQRAAREEATREQQRRQAEARAEAEARYEEQRQQRRAAQARAKELLLSLLTDEQATSYEEKGWFEVRGSRGGRWRIRNRGQAGNVDLMPEIGEIREASYCCHPPGGLPDADAHIAQMLHLVTDEDDFRRTANVAYGPAAA